MDQIATIAALKALSQEHRLAAFRALVAAGDAGLAVGELRDIVAVPAATLTALRVRADYARMNALLAYLTENCCAGAPGACETPTDCC